MNLNFDDLYQIEGGSSQKKIYRFKNNKEKKIVIDFSYESKQFELFLDVYNFLSKINISIPKIFETNINKKIIITEDFGDIRYDKLINNIDPKDILIDAINSLIEIQNTQKPILNKFLKKYDFSSFKIEIAEFADFYLPAYNISKDLVGEFFYVWKSEFDNLNFNWDSFVHKDFELSNLMHLPSRDGHLKCGILDFQNAFIGFSGWDLFSLLENPRINFDDKYNDDLVEYFFNNTNQNLPFSEFLLQYYFLNTARQTRIIGRWINLDKKNIGNNYSKYLNVTIKRLQKSLTNLKNKRLSKLYDTLIIK